MDLKAAVSSDREKNVEMQRGEQVAIDEYDEVINKTNLPEITKNILVKQRNKIQQAQHKMQKTGRLFLKLKCFKKKGRLKLLFRRPLFIIKSFLKGIILF